MKEDDVARLSERFGLDPEIVKSSVEDGTLSQRLLDAIPKAKIDGFVIYKQDEFETFKKNLAAEVTNKYFGELSEGAKKGDIPQDLYTPIKGAAYQQLEREFAKKYGVDNYKNVHDLVDRIVQTSANGKGGEELQKQLNELKEVNVRLEEEKNNAISAVEKKYRTQAIEKDKDSILNSIPFDFSDAKADELETKRSKTKTLLKSVFDSTYSLDYNDKGELIVRNGEDVLKNTATLDPLQAKDVFMSLAKEYNLKLKSPDSGGQGGNSSHTQSTAKMTTAEFTKQMRAKGIYENDKQFVKEWKKLYDAGLIID